MLSTLKIQNKSVFSTSDGADVWEGKGSSGQVLKKIIKKT